MIVGTNGGLIMGETVYLSDSRVLVTDSVVKIDRETHALSAINTISIDRIPQTRGGASISFIALGVLLTLFGLLATAGGAGAGLIFAVIGVALLLFGLGWTKGGEHVLTFATSSGNVSALIEQTPDYLEKLKAAIESAISHKGRDEIVAVNIPPTAADTKACPRCAEEVKAAAVVCKHCGYEFDPARAKELQ